LTHPGDGSSSQSRSTFAPTKKEGGAVLIKGRRTACLLVLIAALLVSAPLLADTVELLPVQDNTLYEPIKQEDYEDRSNGAGKNMFAGKTKDAETVSAEVAVRRAVLAFDIAGNIPADATIDAVQLVLVVNKVKRSNSYSFKLHRLLAEWGEGTSDTGNSQQGRGEPPTAGDATWHHTLYPGQFWTNPGGDYVLGSSATTLVGSTGTYTWGSTSGLVADVQLWLNDDSQNFGWILIGDESQIETAKVLATKENTSNGGLDKPKLIVNYTTVTISGACCQGESCSIETPTVCTTLGGAYQGDGTTCSPNPCAIPFGACCAADGTCTEATQDECDTGGGAFQGDGSTCAASECTIQLTPFVDPLPIPDIATPDSGSIGGVAEYTITMTEFQQQLHSELPPTTVWGYGDGFDPPHFPGPVIVARTGDPVTVHWENDLRELGTSVLRTNHYLAQSADDLICTHGAEDEAKTVVHLHGGHVPAEIDGYPEDTFLPGDAGQTFVYPNNQQASLIWFHDHALGITRLNVYMGLAGGYIIRDDVEDAVNLPAGEYEVPLVIQDRKFNPDGTFYYPGTWQDMFFGDKVLVNGGVWPYLDVRQGKYRFKLLNGSGSRVYTLSLNPPSGLMTFTVIANEGGLLETPARGVSQLTIGPGERYEVVVDFAAYSDGDEIFLENNAPAPFPNGSVDLTQVMKFTVNNLVGHTDPVPDTLRPIERLQETDAVMTRDFELRRSGQDACGRAFWEINGLHWDDIREYPELGTTEIWRFINDSGVSHPMHMHLVFFQVLDREGFTVGTGGEILPEGNPQPPGAEERGWKDTAMVGPNEILRVIARFDDYKGLYAYHCHILEHEDHEMMRQFQTVSCGDGELDPTEGCDDGANLDFDGCSSGCEVEQFIDFVGTAEGGRVEVTIAGEPVGVNTQAGQTVEEIAQALADAINSNTNLQALGITATAHGSRLVTNADYESITSTDPGVGEIGRVTVQPTRVWWGSVGNATGYDLVGGDLNRLRETGGDYSDPQSTEGCLAGNQAATYWEHTGQTVLPGEVLWYLMRVLPGGTYDTGTEAGSRDAGIAASGNDCP